MDGGLMSGDVNDAFDTLAGCDEPVPVHEIDPPPAQVSERLWTLGSGVYVQTDDASAAIAVLWAVNEASARVVVGERPPANGLVRGDVDGPQPPRLLIELFADNGRITYRSFVDALRGMGDSSMESAIYRGLEQQFAARVVEGTGAFSAYFASQEVTDSESACAIRVSMSDGT
jgi:hypothetical protein